MRVRTTSSSLAPSSSSASATISTQRRICPAGSASSSPTGPVPDTSTRSPTRMARLNPMTDSNGEPDEPRCRSTRTLTAGRPDFLGALVVFLAGRPQLVARLGLLDSDLLRRVDHQVHRLAHRDVLPERLLAAPGLGAMERLLELALARLRPARALRGREQRVEQLLVGHLDPL